MKKLINLKIFVIFVITLTNTYSSESNIGFLSNQKYICVGTEAMVGEEVIQIQSREDSLKYPSRFYIDDHQVLRTDGAGDNVLIYNAKRNAYESKDSAIFLKIVNNKRMMFRMLLSGKLKGITLIHTCVETDNWTLVK